MRRFVLAAFYVAMIAGGFYLALGTLVYGGRVSGAAVGGFLTVFGTYLLWTDFSGSGA